MTTDIWYPAIANGDEDFTRYNPLLPSDGTYYKALEGPTVAEGTFPLLVFSHGSFAYASSSATLMEHLASWGFVVAAPDHAGNSYNDDPNNPVPFSTKDRPMDVSFVIDSLLESPEDFSISSSLIGVLGNSYGGLTAGLVASGFEDYERDTRVLATMPISPSINFGSEDRGILSNIAVPMLLMGGVNDTTTPIANNELFFEESINSFPRWSAVIENAGHSSFQDICILYEIVLNNFANGNVDLTYTLLGNGNLEIGKERIESAFCTNSLEDTLPVVDFSAVAFFRSILLGDSIARNCLKDLYAAQQPPISFAFGIDEESKEEEEEHSHSHSRDEGEEHSHDEDEEEHGHSHDESEEHSHTEDSSANAHSVWLVAAGTSFAILVILGL